MTRSHIFVDYENVHHVDLDIFDQKCFSMTLLMGARQSRLDVQLVNKLMQHSHCVELVNLTTTGSNALDFVLAYYLGRATLSDPHGDFHIISKDEGFDPLIAQLRSQNINIRRQANYDALTGKTTPLLADEEQLACVLERLERNTKSRPATRRRLAAYVEAALGSQATEAQIPHLLAQLEEGNHLTMDPKGRVRYHF